MTTISGQPQPGIMTMASDHMSVPQQSLILILTLTWLLIFISGPRS